MPKTPMLGPNSVTDAAYQKLSEKNQPNGYLGLDADGNAVGHWLPIADTKAVIDAITLGSGEVAVCTDTGEMRLGDGATPGGISLTTSRILYESSTAVGNVGAGQDDLMSFTLLLNTLRRNGDKLKVEAHLGFALTGAYTHYLSGKFFFGSLDYVGSLGVGFAPSELTHPARCKVTFYITRVSDTSVNIRGVERWYDGSTLAPVTSAIFARFFTETVETSTALKTVTGLAANATVIKFTGQDYGTDFAGAGAVDNIIKQNYMRVTWSAAP